MHHTGWLGVTAALLGTMAVLVTTPRAAFGDTVDFANQSLVAAWHAEGLWNMQGLGTFNGQPFSETNQPSPAQRRFACDVSLYLSADDANVAYLRFHNIVTTVGLSFSGPDSFLGSMAVTAVRLELATSAGVVLVPIEASNQFANIGQILQHGPCSAPVTSPMLSTDGWSVASSGAELLASADAFPAYAMSDWGWFCGATPRIRGGGVFRLAFEGNLIERVDACASIVHVVFGNNAQVFLAEPLECRCDADLNADGVVSASDLARFFNVWGSVPDGYADALAADLDGDGIIGPADLSLLLSSWGACR